MSNKLTVAYGRLSQEDINKLKQFSSSIYHQLSIIKSYTKEIGLHIDKEYIDDGFSGANFDRPAFEKLKDDIESGSVGTVITKDMSRLGRNFIETAYYIGEYFPRNNVRYIAINDQFDSDRPDVCEQQIMMEIKALINDRYVKEVSTKRKQVAEAKTEEGQFIGPLPPYGYRIKKENGRRTLEIDEYSAGIVKRIFSEVASGRTRSEVADGLNKDEITPPIIYMNMTQSEKKKYYFDWSDKIIYRILKNKTYMGKIVKRKSSKRDYHQKKRDFIPIRDRETIEHCHPVIITEELFDEANNRLKIMKRKEKNDYSGLFSKLVICGECGNTMTVCRRKRENNNIKHHFVCTRVNDRKRCSNRTVADSKLQLIVTNTLKGLINSYIDKDEITTRAIKKLLKEERPNLKIAQLKEKIELHNTNIRNLYLKKTTGEICLDEFIEKKEAESLLKEQSEKLLKEVIESKNEVLRKQELLEKYNKFISGENLINDVIRDLIDKIIIYKDHTIEISFKFGIDKPKEIKLY